VSSWCSRGRYSKAGKLKAKKVKTKKLKHTQEKRAELMSEAGDLRPIFIKIAPEDIVWLKSILESYEDLGIIRTLNRLKGEIVILALSDTVDDLHQLLLALQKETNFRIIPPSAMLCQEGMCEDWLLTENKILFSDESDFN
jgi:hypothetical protein